LSDGDGLRGGAARTLEQPLLGITALDAGCVTAVLRPILATMIERHADMPGSKGFLAFLKEAVGRTGISLFRPRLYEQQEIVGGEGNAPGKKHPKKPRMGRIPDQIDSGKRDNDNEKDGKMDDEAAQRRFAELQLLRCRARSFRH
jgi:hypothetical protein